MPLASIGPVTAMLTPILGKMQKMCQFSAAYLAPKLRLAAELPALSILAEPPACSTTSGETVELGLRSRPRIQLRRRRTGIG